MDYAEDSVMKDGKPAYPTLLDLIRNRVKRTAVAGGSAVIMASAGCGSGGGDSASDPGFAVDTGLVAYDYLGPVDAGGEDVYVVPEILEGLPDPGQWDPGGEDLTTKDLPVEADTMIFPGIMVEDVHNTDDPDGNDEE